MVERLWDGLLEACSIMSLRTITSEINSFKIFNLSGLVDTLIYLVERNIKHAEIKDFS